MANLIPFTPDRTPLADPVERSKAARDQERATAIATLLAGFDAVHDLSAQGEKLRAHYLQWAWVAMRGAGQGPGAFAISAVGMHKAAQAAHDCDADLHGTMAVDLLGHVEEGRHWTPVAAAAVRAHLDHLGKVDASSDRTLGYAQRLGLEA